MSEVEQYLIEKYLKTNEVKIVGDTRELREIHLFSGVGPTVKG